MHQPCYLCDELEARQRNGGIWLCMPCHLKRDAALQKGCLIEDLSPSFLTNETIAEAEAILNGGVINFDPKYNPYDPDATDQALQKYQDQHGEPMPVDEFFKMING